MRKLDGEQVLMRIFVGESDRWEHRPLHAALLELFRTRGLAGATVLRAVAGFGANSVVHTANILRLSADDITFSNVMSGWCRCASGFFAPLSRSLTATMAPMCVGAPERRI